METNRSVLKGLRVLVIDDDTDTRELFAFVLLQEGADVFIASSAQEAINTLNQAELDLVLSDIQMPEEDGYGLIGQIRALEARQGKHIPAIAITAYAREEDRLRALSAGFQCHLAKPVDLDELITTVVSCVDTSAPRDASCNPTNSI